VTAVRPAALLFLTSLVLGGVGRAAESGLPEGCRAGVSPLCADPAWPASVDPPPPVSRLTGRLVPAAALPEREAPADE